MPETTALRLRFMHVQDLQQVLAIEAQSFDSPWAESSYRFEINQSQVSHMVVLENPEVRPVSGWRRWLQGVRGESNLTEMYSHVVGYGGLWRIAEEAHVSTIASHPAYRGKGYGELILAGMLQRAVRLSAEYVVLEVRVSNEVAQKLYLKYGFETVRTRANYYQKEQEDAYEMRLNLNEKRVHELHKRYQELLRKHKFQDDYSLLPHPRLGKQF